MSPLTPSRATRRGRQGAGDLALHLAATEDERARAGRQGGVEHFGIHLAPASAAAVDEAVRRAEQADGRLVKRGEHAPGPPYAFVADPDGYVIEISRPAPATFTPGRAVTTPAARTETTAPAVTGAHRPPNPSRPH